MRINWGVRLIILYSSFVVFMLFMVYKCTRQHYDLVSGDYYEKELKYQEVIDGSNNLEALNRKVVIDNTGDTCYIRIPVNASLDAKGEVFFYRPSNAAGDLRLQITANEAAVPRAKLYAGLYKVKSAWTAGDKKYYDEQTLVVR